MWLLKASEQTTDAGESLGNGTSGPKTGEMEELKEQFEQQQVLLQQLKDLVRQNEQQLRKKEEDLEESVAKLSKLKLQHKAKIAQMNNQLLEAQGKHSSSPVKGQNAEDESTAREASSVDTSRGKVLMLKKQLEESRAIFEKRQKEMSDNKRSVEEVLINLQTQLEEKDKIISHLKSENMPSESDIPSASQSKQDETGLQEMYAQIVYKDSKIMELDSRILQLERQVMDLQENVREKDEVIQTRNKAIQLMTQDLGRRGKVVVDQLDDTRDQMRFMQENFAQMETEWREKETRLTNELTEFKSKYERDLSEKETSISELKTSLTKLENVRFELSSRNAQLQEKVVRLQETLEKTSKNSTDGSVSEIQKELDHLKEDLKKRDVVIAELRQSGGGSSKPSNQQMLKLKAQHKSQMKALEMQIKELKNGGDNSNQLTALQNRLADLEEEKGNLQLKLVDFDEYAATCGRQQLQIVELKERVQHLSTDLDNHVKMISMVEGEKLDLIEQLAEKNRLIEDLEKSGQDAGIDLQSSTENEARLKLEIEELKLSKEAVLDSYRELQSKMEKLESIYHNENESSNLRLVNEELRNALSELQLDFSNAKTECDTLKLELRDRDDVITKLDGKLLETNQEIDELKSEKNALNSLIQERDNIVLQQRNEIDKVNEANAELAAVVNSKDREIDELNILVQQMDSNLRAINESRSADEKNVDDKMASFIEQLQELESEVQRLQQLNAEQQQELINERETYAEEVQSLTSAASQKQNEFDVILEKNSELTELRDQLQNSIQEKIAELTELNALLKQKDERLIDTLNNLSATENNLTRTSVELQTIMARKDEIEEQYMQLQAVIDSKNRDLENVECALNDKSAQCLRYQTELHDSAILVDKLQNEINEHTDQCTHLRETIAANLEEQLSLELNITSLHDELKNNQERVLKLDEEKTVLRDELNNVTIATETLETDFQALKNGYQHLQDEKDDEIRQLSSKLEHLHTLGGSQETWTKTLEAELASAKSDLQKSKQEICDFDAQIATLKGLEEKWQLDNASLKAENLQLSTELSDSAGAIDSLKKELKSTKANLENVTSCLESVNIMVESSSSAVRDLEAELSETRQQLEVIRQSLGEQLTTANSKIEELSVELEKSASVETELGILRAEYTQTVNDCDNKVFQMESKISELSSSLQEKELELNDNGMKCQELENQYTTRISALEDEYNQCVNDRDNKIVQLEAKISELCSSLQETELKLTDDGEKSQAMEDLYTTQIQTITKELDDIKSRLQIVESERDAIMQEKAELLSKTEQLRQSLERLEFFEAEYHKSVDSVGCLESEVRTLNDENSRVRDQNARLLEYTQQLEADLASVSDAAKETEAEKNTIYAEFWIRRGKLESLIAGTEYVGSDMDAKQISDGNYESLLTKFDALYANLQAAMEDRAKHRENVDKLLTDLLNMQGICAEVEIEKQKLEQKFLDFSTTHTELEAQVDDLTQKLELAFSANRTTEENLSKINEDKVALAMANQELSKHLDQLSSEMQEEKEQNINIQAQYKESQMLVESLHIQVQQLNEHVQSLQSGASEQVQTLSEQLAVANALVQKFQTETSELQAQISNKDLELDNFKTRVLEFEEKCNDSSAKHKESQIQVESLQIQVQQLNEHIQALQSSASEQIKTLSEQLDSANVDLHNFQTEIRELQAQISAKDAALHNFKTRVVEFEEKCNDSSAKHKEAQMQVESLQIQVQQLNEHIQSLQRVESEQIQALSEQLAAANVDLKNFQTEVSELQAQISTKDTEMDNFKTRIMEFEEKCNDSSAKHKESQMQVQSLQIQVQQLNKHVQSLQSGASEQIQTLSKQLASANVDLQNFQTEICELQAQISTKDTELDNFKTCVVEYEEKCNDSSAKHKESQMQVESLQIQVQQLNEHLQSLQSGASEQVQTLSGQLAVVSVDIQNFQTENRELQVQISNRDTELDNFKIQIKEFEEKCEALEDQNKKLKQDKQEFIEELDSVNTKVQALTLENKSHFLEINQLKIQLEEAENDLKEREVLGQINADEIQRLSQCLDERDKSLEKMENSLNSNGSLQARIKDLENSLQIRDEGDMSTDEKWQSLLRNSEIRIEELQIQVENLTRKSEAADSEIGCLQSDVEAKTHQLGDIQLALNQKNEEVNNANELLTNISRIILQLKASLLENDIVGEGDLNLPNHREIKPTETEETSLFFENLEKTLLELNVNVLAYKSKMAALQESLRLSESTVLELKSEKEHLIEEASNLKEQHVFLQAQLSESFDNIGEFEMLKAQSKTISKEKSKVESKLKEQENVIEALLDQRRHLEERLKDIQEQSSRGIAEIHRLNMENSQMYEHFQVRHDAQQVEIGDLKAQLDNLNDLKTKLDELESSNAILNEENENFKSNMSTGKIDTDAGLKSEMQKLEQEISRLQEEKALYKEQLQATTEEIRRLNEEKSNLVTDINAEQVRFEKLSTEYEQLEISNKELTNQLRTYENRLQEVENFEIKIKEDHRHQEKQYLTTEHLLQASDGSPASPAMSPEHKQLKTQLAVLQIKNEKMLSKLKLFKDKNDKLQLQISNLMSAQASLEDDKMRISDYNEHAKDEIRHLSSELRNVERLWKTEVQMLQDRLDTVEVANGKIVEIKEDIERKLMKEIELNESHLKEKVRLEKIVSDTNAKLLALESGKKETVDQMILQQEQLQRKLESLRTNNGFLESDNAEFQHLIEKLRAEKSRLEQEIKNQSEKYVLLVQEHSKLKTEFGELGTKRISAGDISDLKKSYATLQKDYKELLNVKLHLEAQIEDLKIELDAAIADKARLEKDVANAKAARNQSDEKLEDTESMFHEVEVLQAKNSELLAKISGLEGEIWKLEGEKQQLVESGQHNEQKSLNKVSDELEKSQSENRKLLAELELQDVELKNLEVEKEQIEAEFRLTFQQQQETIKGIKYQLQLREESAKYTNENEAPEELVKLNGELSHIKDEFSQVVLQLRSETEKCSDLQSRNDDLETEVETMRNELQHYSADKHNLNIEINNLRQELVSVEQEVEHWKRQYFADIERRHDGIANDFLQKRPMSGQSIENEDIPVLKAQIEKLLAELQHTMQSLHAKDLQCEELTTEFTELIEERDSLQLRLSSLLRADQQKEMKLKLFERERLARSVNYSIESDIGNNGITQENENTSKVSAESLSKKLQACEEQRKELQQINAVLDQALAAERDHRVKITADLKFANEELAALDRRKKFKQQTSLTLDDDGQVPLLPEHSQTLERSYVRTAWRITNWLQGRSTPRIMHV